MPADPSLLVVEDEPAMATVITAGLTARGYSVQCVGTGADALRAVGDAPPTVVVLDLGLPDIDGIDVCRAMREMADVPIIVVTADGAEDRMVDALDSGADDYITKPFSMRQLLARVRVAIRHHEGPSESGVVHTVGDITVDVDGHRVTVGGADVSLTPKEFAMVSLLARHPGRVLTHRTILNDVWGPEADGHVEYLRVFVRAIRQKFNEDPQHPRLITESGVGYRLVDRTGPQLDGTAAAD